jgi:L-threonylcarbamoyladenylate synthase
MTVFELNPADPDPELLGQISSLLTKDGVIAYPTDTLYGIGGDGFNPDTHHKIIILKGRDGTKPFPYIIDSVDRIGLWQLKLGVVAAALMKQFWPGPVSLVLNGSDELPRHIFDKNRTVCLRLPDNAIARALAAAVKGLLISTSANLAGRAPATCAREAMGYFRGEIDAVVDGGPSVGREPSTIVDVSGNDAVIVREGAIPAEKIRTVAADAKNRRTR